MIIEPLAKVNFPTACHAERRENLIFHQVFILHYVQHDKKSHFARGSIDSQLLLMMHPA
jgi:hypothetical protein